MRKYINGFITSDEVTKRIFALIKDINRKVEERPTASYFKLMLNAN